MAPRCRHEGMCAVPPHPDLLARQKHAFLKVQGTEHEAAFRKAFKPIHVTGNIPGQDDGTIFPPSHYKGKVPSIAAMSLAASERAPLRGTLNAVLVLVDFADVKTGPNAKQHFEDLWFSTGKIPTGSVKEYYQEVSHGAITLAGEVLGPFQLSHNMAYYANGHAGRDGPEPNSQTMAAEAVRLATGKTNFDKFDNDGNGYVDLFCIVHAGTSAEVLPEPQRNDFIWSVKWNIPQEQQLDNVKVFGFLTVPEDARLGVCAHEIGHLLFGWPDLYDTDTIDPSAGIGNWCLMSYGSWGSGGDGVVFPGDRPVHPSAWCKANQGWISVVNETENHKVTIPDVKSGFKVHRLWKNGDTTSQEYFLVENRQLNGYDVSLPASGLLVWHIDDSIWGNQNEWHPKVGLMQADGFQQLQQRIGTSYGDAGDPFPGISNNSTFNATSNPNSKAYSGDDTFVSITNIPPNAASMTVDITVKAIAPPADGFDPKMWYRLSNTFAGYSLDVVNDGAGNPEGLIQMGRTGNFSGQFWQITPNGTGTYALRSLFLGASRQLDVYASDKLKPRLATAGPYSGQIWKILPWGDGTWHLENMYSGSGLYLDTMEGGPRVAMNQANVGRPTQRWTIAPLRPVTEPGF